jgi:hypothetical protein
MFRKICRAKDWLGPCGTDTAYIFEFALKPNLEDEDDDEYEDETSGDLCYHQPEPKVSERGAIHFSDHSRWLAGWVYTLAEPSFADL